MPEWIPSNSCCDIRIQYFYNSYVDTQPLLVGTQGELATFDAVARQFFYYYEGDYDLGGTSEVGIVYTITVHGFIPDTDISEVATYELTVFNPCFDSSIVCLNGPILPDFYYALESAQNTWTH